MRPTPVLVFALLATPHVQADQTTPIAIPPFSWAQVENSNGQIPRLRTLTHFALNAPIPDLLRVLDAQTFSATAQPTTEEVRLLAHALVTRDLSTARRYLTSGQERLSTGFLKGVFGALAQYHPDLLRDELLKLSGEDRNVALYETLDALTPRDPDTAIALFREVPLENAPFLRDYFSFRLVRHAPVKAIDFILAEHAHLPPAKQTEWLQRQLLGIGETDFDALLNLTSTNRDSPLGSTLRDLVVKSIRDEQGVIINGHTKRSDIHTDRLRSLSRFAKELPDDHRQNLFTSLLADFGKYPRLDFDLLSTWHDIAPDQVRAWNSTLTNTSRQAFRLLLDIDPALALTRLQNTPPSPERTDMLGELTRSFAIEDLPSTVVMTTSLPAGPERDKAFTALAEVATDYDPETFANELANLPDNASTAKLAAGFASKWFSQDPNAASDWLAALPPGETRTSVLKATARALAHSSPDQAIAMLGGQDALGEHHALLEALADEASPPQGQAILGLINTLPASTQQKWLRNKAISSLAKKDPALAVQLATSGQAGPANDDLQQALVRGWAETSAADCAKWVQQALASPSGIMPSRESLRTAARSYAHQHPDAALVWAASLPSPQHVKVATLEISEALAETLPDRAWSIALSTDPTPRQLLRVFREINHHHSDQIPALLASSRLNDELLQQLSQSLNQR